MQAVRMQAGDEPMSAVGVVGLGAMGGRIAGRLLAQGYAVTGTNRTRDRAAELIDQGLVWSNHPRAVAERSDVVISMVTNDAALDAVIQGGTGSWPASRRVPCTST